MEKKSQIKNGMRDVFNFENIFLLSQRIKSNYSNFDDIAFNNKIKLELLNLSVMDRSILIENTLGEFLPNDFKKLVEIILKSQLKELPNEIEENYLGDFIGVPQANLISKLGCNKKYFHLSMNALYEITKRFSCEFAIHDFIDKFEDESFRYLKIWAKDKNYHVRRLCSEGIRPALPWSRVFKKFKKDPSRLFEILDLLYFDKNRFVTRSVCNCLNDISKTHPKLVIEKLKIWENSLKQNTCEFEWMKKHAMRTLIKNANLDALDYLGFKINVNLDCDLLIKNSKIKLNDYLKFGLKIKPKENSNLLIDYLIYFVKSNGKLSSKVFKLKILKSNKNEMIVINKKHLFKFFTTRKLYTGTHYLQIQINGKKYIKKEFYFQNL